MTIESALMKELQVKILENLDLDAFAKKLAPQILEEFERNIFDEMTNSIDWNDFIYEIIYNDEVKKAFTNKIKDAILKGLK